MIRRTPQRDAGTVRITFSLPLEDAPNPVSVVGDFNDWDPAAHPLRKRSNGTRSVTVDIPSGTSTQFKYLDAEGNWFREPAADGASVNEWGEVNDRLDA